MDKRILIFDLEGIIISKKKELETLQRWISIVKNELEIEDVEKKCQEARI